MTVTILVGLLALWLADHEFGHDRLFQAFLSEANELAYQLNRSIADFIQRIS